MSSGQYSLEEEMIEGPKCSKPCPYRDERVPITREKVVTELDYRPVRTPVYIQHRLLQCIQLQLLLLCIIVVNGNISIIIHVIVVNLMLCL